MSKTLYVSSRPRRTMQGRVELAEWIIEPGTQKFLPEVHSVPRRLSVPCVYVIDMKGTPFCKVGSTSNIRSRIATAQSISPYDLEWHFYIAPAVGVSHIDVERKAHELLQAAHRRGEWFNCSTAEAVAAIVKAHDAIRALEG